MPEWRVPLADVVVDEADLRAVTETYRSGWLSMGPRTEELEAAFRKYTGAEHAVATSSCTAALHLICLGAGLAEGDEVIVPSLTFVATVNAIAYTGATPVFADIGGLTTPWPTAAEVEPLVGERTKAIMTMAYGGHPGATAELAALAAERDLILLEDAAHAVGGSQDGRALGTWGRAGAYSFFSNKNLPAGEGGMLVSDDSELADRARLLRSHGMTSLSWDRHRGHARGYDVVARGFNYRIDEPRAAFVRERLRRLDADNARRAELDARYRDALSHLDGIEPLAPASSGQIHAHHLFAAVLDPDRDRDAFREGLAAAGIQTSLHYPPAHRFSIYEDPASLPRTDAYAERAVTLPLFPHMTADQFVAVAEAIAAALS